MNYRLPLRQEGVGDQSRSWRTGYGTGQSCDCSCPVAHNRTHAGKQKSRMVMTVAAFAAVVQDANPALCFFQRRADSGAGGRACQWGAENPAPLLRSVHRSGRSHVRCFFAACSSNRLEGDAMPDATCDIA